MIKSLRLTNFRLFDKLNLDFNNSFVILSGKNATGKTSILEAIHIAATTKSHRTIEVSEAIQFKKEFSKIELEEDKKYKVVLSEKGKSLFINDKEIKRSGEYLGNLNVCMIAPSDISLVSGTKIDKRRFLDLNISVLDKKYLNELSTYKKLLNERNSLLKSETVDKVMLNIITDDLIKSLKYIYDSRMKIINDINLNLNDICKRMNIEHIELIYEPTYNASDMKKSFDLKLESDLFYRATQIGAHRDSFKILINNLDASTYASEGQSRIIYIAIKLAIKKIFSIYIGEPVLLLDDIFMALDKNRIKALTEYVKESKQVFITTTTLEKVPEEILNSAVVITIGNKGENK